MMVKRNPPTREKIQYSPIEAAIRWSDLYEQEAAIFERLAHCGTIHAADLSEWPSLQLNFDRIVDALLNHELPYCRNAVICTDIFSPDDLDITIHHVALKA